MSRPYPAATGAAEPPAGLVDLLERPLVGTLATLRPDGTLQNNPMWFSYADGWLLMSHTSSRQKLTNLRAHPHVSYCIIDPENTYRYLEIRAEFVGELPDEGASFHRELRARYGMETRNVPDAETRVVLRFCSRAYSGRDMKRPPPR